MTSGDQLKALLKEKKITQGELAAMIGTNQTYISNMVTGRVRISGKFRKKICDALKLDEAWFENYISGADGSSVQMPGTSSDKTELYPEDPETPETGVPADAGENLSEEESLDIEEFKGDLPGRHASAGSEKKTEISILSSRYPCGFNFAGLHYFSMLQFVISRKALLYNDLSCYDLARRSEKDEELLYIAEILKGNDQELWKQNENEIYYLGNRAKFTENGEMMTGLILTGDWDFKAPEASPYSEDILDESAFLQTARQVKQELLASTGEKKKTEDRVEETDPEVIQKIKYIVSFPDPFHPKMEQQEVFDIYPDKEVQFKQTSNKKTTIKTELDKISAEDFEQLCERLNRIRKNVREVREYNDEFTAKIIMVMDPYYTKSFPRGYSDGDIDMATVLNHFLAEKAHFDWND